MARLSSILPGWALVLCVVLGLVAGCAHQPPSLTARAASFDGMRESRLDGELLSDFMRKRSAILVDGTVVIAGRPRPGSNEVTVQFAGGRAYSTGMAAAIDPRGYFLTAGHSLQRSPYYLISHDGIGFRVFEARVVWKGIYEEGQPDVALLHVNRPLLFTFDWDDAWEVGQATASLGMEFDSESGYSLISLGGGLQQITEHPDNTPHRTSFFHETPLRRGDSGGPLVGPDGGLIAINVGTLRKFAWRGLHYEISARAHRPDVQWLRELIDRDFATVNPEAAASFRGPP